MYSRHRYLAKLLATVSSFTPNQVGEEPDDFNESCPILKPSQGAASLT
ncbi:hypothetical protein H6F51_16730 [Cyanobacteria bacterium FACHB-DQ100]|nr:hypothetical protein [Cyanobacteria bacterium FACHB-DQ100]